MSVQCSVVGTDIQWKDIVLAVELVLASVAKVELEVPDLEEVVEVLAVADCN